jgi:hypothetical protein
MVMPVEFALKFEGQPVERVRWDGRDRIKAFTFTRPQRLEWANIDPDRKLELDVDWLNNGRRIGSDGRVPVKWASGLMFIVQALLTWIGA